MQIHQKTELVDSSFGVYGKCVRWRILVTTAAWMYLLLDRLNYLSYLITTNKLPQDWRIDSLQNEWWLLCGTQKWKPSFLMFFRVRQCCDRRSRKSHGYDWNFTSVERVNGYSFPRRASRKLWFCLLAKQSFSVLQKYMQPQCAVQPWKYMAYLLRKFSQKKCFGQILTLSPHSLFCVCPCVCVRVWLSCTCTFSFFLANYFSWNTRPPVCGRSHRQVWTEKNSVDGTKDGLGFWQLKMTPSELFPFFWWKKVSIYLWTQTTVMMK